MTEIRPLTVDDAEGCDAVVASLPYHFGDPDGQRMCNAAVREQDGFVAMDGGSVVGFVTLARHYDRTAEITWMAVRADRRGGGIGSALLRPLEDLLLREGRTLLLVFTVSPADPDEIPDGYNATRAFYAANGFVAARDLPDLWPGDTAMLFVKPLAPRKPTGWRPPVVDLCGRA
ncbi:MAG: GNAT family N-acetyltransferase [Actinomycetota bacterium]